jgi:hypothetical protein
LSPPPLVSESTITVALPVISSTPCIAFLTLLSTLSRVDALLYCEALQVYENLSSLVNPVRVQEAGPLVREMESVTHKAVRPDHPHSVQQVGVGVEEQVAGVGQPFQDYPMFRALLIKTWRFLTNTSTLFRY